MKIHYRNHNSALPPVFMNQDSLGGIYSRPLDAEGWGLSHVFITSLPSSQVSYSQEWEQPPIPWGCAFLHAFPTVPVPTCMLDADCGFVLLAITYRTGQDRTASTVQAPFLCRSELRAWAPWPAVHFLPLQQLKGNVTVVNVNRCV